MAPPKVIMAIALAMAFVHVPAWGQGVREDDGKFVASLQVIAPLADHAAYRVRVRVPIAGPDDACASSSGTDPSDRVNRFRLNLSLRGIAPAGTPTQEAIALSLSRF